MKFDDLGLAFPQECLRAALLVSLLSVWALVGLFYYLNRYSRREYFSIWTGAWLFYALWLTLSLGLGNAAPGSILFAVNQSCVSMAAVFLLWGCVCFLGLQVPQRLFNMSAVFVAVWIMVSPQMMKDSLQIHLPVFILLGLSSPFAGACFFRLQKQDAFVGAGMLSLGFLLWVIYIGSYPFSAGHGNLYSAGFFIAALLQLVIAVTMIVQIFQEIRNEARQVRAEIEAVRLEKEALTIKVITPTEAGQALSHRVRASEETEKAVVERDRLLALGEMAGDVAHDINNALSPIAAYSEMLLNMPDLADVPRQRLQQISHAAEEVAQIVAHMREFYRAAPAAKASGSTEPKPGRALQPAGTACRPLRILCIDDEPQVRELLHDVLETEYHRVAVATGGKEGLEMFRTHLRAGEPYEVVITDLGMPDVDGHEVARAIKAESPQTPIIMLTGWGTMMKADGEKAPAVDAVLGKPPRMQELSSLIFQVTARSAT